MLLSGITAPGLVRRTDRGILQQQQRFSTLFLVF
jgi:hypothetical protein